MAEHDFNRVLYGVVIAAGIACAILYAGQLRHVDNHSVYKYRVYLYCIIITFVLSHQVLFAVLA